MEPKRKLAMSDLDSRTKLKDGHTEIQSEIGKDEEIDMGEEDTCPPKCPT